MYGSRVRRGGRKDYRTVRCSINRGGQEPKDGLRDQSSVGEESLYVGN